MFRPTWFVPLLLVLGIACSDSHIPRIDQGSGGQGGQPGHGGRHGGGGQGGAAGAGGGGTAGSGGAGGTGGIGGEAGIGAAGGGGEGGHAGSQAIYDWEPTDLTGVGAGQLLGLHPVEGAPGMLWLSAHHGHLVSRALGTTWIRPSLPAGTVMGLGRGDGGLLVAIADRGLFRSSDEGETWQRLGGWNPRWVWVEGGENVFEYIDGAPNPMPLMRSHDMGETWNLVGHLPSLVVDGPLVTVESVRLLPDHHGTVRLWRSLDGGVSWSGATGPVPKFLDHLTVHGSTVFGISQHQIWRSEDLGQTWVQDGLPEERGQSWIRGFARVGSSLFAGVAGSVFRLDADTGAWTPAMDGLHATQLTAIAGLGSEFFARSNERLLRWDPGSQAWTPADQSLHAVQVAVLGGIGDELLMGTPGGRIARTFDGGTTWEWIESGEDDPSGFFGLHDGTWLAWSSQGILRSENHGSDWSLVHPGGPHASPRPFVSLQGAIFTHALGGELLRSNDGGGTWTEITDRLPRHGTTWDGRPRYADVSKLFPYRDVLLLASSTHGLLRSEDGGETFVESSAGLHLASTPVVPNTFASHGGVLYAGVARSDQPGLWYSLDGGHSWEPEGGPPVPGTYLQQLVGLEDQLLAVVGLSGTQPEPDATEAVRRVWSSTDGGHSWEPLGGAFPVPVVILRVGEGHLFAGTEGAGVWRFPLDAPR